MKQEQNKNKISSHSALNSEANKNSNNTVILDGIKADFGKTACDYATHRHGFPDEFFQRLKDKNLFLPKDKVLDLGTGTGTIAIGLAQYGCSVTGTDIAPPMLEQAKAISQKLGLNIDFRYGSAESTGMQDHQFDIVVAGQCWHWFEHDKAISEITRVLKPTGRLIIAHFDWLPIDKSIAQLSENLIIKYNPRWKGAHGTGFYPHWTTQLANAGFTDIETYTFDTIAAYNHESWRGRIRASAGISGTLSVEEVGRFDEEHKTSLEKDFPNKELGILHRCFTLTAKPPKN
jgi:ubiquinone/menaquinone biosynthesis C-methylase UbiE